MYSHTHYVKVRVLPIKNVAAVGFKIAQFSQRYPDVNFDWREIDAEDYDDDLESVIFQFEFETIKGYDLFAAYWMQRNPFNTQYATKVFR